MKNPSNIRRCWKCRGSLKAETVLNMYSRLSILRFICLGCGRAWPAGVKLLTPSPRLATIQPQAVQ